MTIFLSGFASYFVSFEYMMQQTERPSAFYTLMAGGLAGTFSWIISFPVDVVKSRLQVDGIDGTTKYNGAIDCMKKSYREEGYKFFTRGLNSTLMRAFPMNAVCFLVVSQVMKFMENKSLNVTIAEPEPLNLVNAYSQNSFIVRVFEAAHTDLRHHMRYMIFLDGFHEAACHSDMMELSDELREKRSNTTYFYKTNDGIVENKLTSAEMREPLVDTTDSVRKY